MTTTSDLTKGAEAASADMSGTAGNTVQTCPRVTLEIGVFFDGTGNNTANSIEGGDSGSYGNARSNVSLLHEIYKIGDRWTELADCGSPKTKFSHIYKEGIGTTSGGWDYNPFTLTGAATGMGPEGVEARVYQACLDVGKEIDRLSPLEEPEEIVLDVFGFSRGAAAARYFVNCFRQGYVEYDAYYANRKRARLPEDRNVRIRYIGIFDTVAAVGDGKDDDNGAVNVHVSSAQCERIYHLTAQNEYRENFRLNDNQPGGGEVRRLPGAHSDVGGGYRDPGDRTVVAPTRTRVFGSREQAETARSTAIQTAELARSSREAFWVSEGWIRPNEPRGGFVNTPGPVTMQRAHGVLGSSLRTYTFEEGERLDRPWVQPGLSRIPLRIMYEDAKKAGVPLLAFPATAAEYTVPPELEALAPGMAQGGPTPPPAQTREILRNFGHVSSNYGKIGMSPDKNFERVVYPNEPGKAK
ncbi:DUF2235 domain-containing protein [Tritonibacter scottomollicae]|uniref:DUF2235 domain-containing protein n=1 Tax=Tritonibacter scottomollicae TaxID=483013 RepID=A0ABZ0HH98_TRISK|nr:DUF2235 domain-containing protein [Tritonibacter scottomollicae]WOI33821.1 DUF2235 domain-containing protein [Tritonibacter scottomollicae]